MERKDGTKRSVLYRGASARVLEFLRTNADVVLPYGEIQRSLEIPAYTVSNSIQLLIGKNIANIERPIKGMVIYHSGKAGAEVKMSDEAKAALAQQTVKPLAEPAESQIRERELARIANDLTEKGIAEMDAVSPYPAKVLNNSDYGRTAPLFDYVGKMEAYAVIRDQAEDLYVAMPLLAFLDRQ